MDGNIGPYLAVGITGVIHGLEPGHGWPLAVLASRERHRSIGYAGTVALVLGLGHLVSAFAVVAVYVIAGAWLDFGSALFRYAGAALLLFLAWRMWREAPGQHEAAAVRPVLSLAALAWAAVVLGFAHEEEFMLLGLAVGGLNVAALMAAYSLAVILSMTAITTAMYAAFARLEPRFKRVEPILPKVTAVALVVLAGLLLLDVY